MIELLSESKCVSCNLCVTVCPTNVFDKVEGGYPVIARQDDCQTCFMCELYCPTDALFVAPQADESITILEDTVVENGLLGSYRERIGWGKGRTSTANHDASFMMFREMKRQSGH